MDKTLMLKQIKEYYKFESDADFAKHLSISRQTLSNWKARNTYDAELLYTKCLHLNPEWLLTGNGSMLKEEKEIEIKKLDQSRKTIDAHITDQEVPLYDIHAMAGLQELFNTGKPAQVLETIQIPNLPRCDGAITITGDSMYPLLKSGDIILYAITSIENIFYGEMYLLGIQLNDFEEFITVKYIHRSDHSGNIKLVSQNKHHDDKEVPLKSIRSIALVKASIRFNTMA